MEKISVIVPIYNVETYLEDCIISLVNQTYENIEIILVDDGSTDNSFEVCQKYVSNSKVKLIHQENKGVSAARNKGMKKASGDYLAFVDPDDYVANNYLDTLYKLIKETSAQISIVASDSVKENINYVAQEEYLEINLEKKVELSKQETLDVMLSRNGFGIAPWGKLFKSNLFSKIKWPEGKIFEDLITIPYIVDKCNKIVFLSGEDNALYHWRSRSNSTTRDKNVNNKIDALLTAQEQLKRDMLRRYPQLESAMQARYIEDVINILVNKLIYDDEFIMHWKYIYNFDKDMWKKIVFNNRISILKKIRAILLKTNPQVYKHVMTRHLNRR